MNEGAGTRGREDWSKLALGKLSHGGRRAGGARRAVIAQLADQECCLSAQEIAGRIRVGGGRVGTASVYRALELLCDDGLVQRIELGEGGARFEPIVPGARHHHHAVCDDCGRLTPFEDASLERAIERVSSRLSHRVYAHDVLIRGRCPRCSTDRA